MILQILQLIVGIAILLGGAEMLVRGSRSLALSFGISTLIVGLTVVAFGTSAPELFVSLAAALDGTADVAIGNVIGSNLFNFLVIIGISAILSQVVIAKQLIRIEIPIMLCSLFAMYFFARDGVIERFEGILLFIGLLGYLLYSYLGVTNDDADSQPQTKDLIPLKTSILFVVLGLVGLVIGARFIVDGAVFIARSFGISELIIGVTLVAAGTSLPELATTIIAAKEGEPDLAVGNAVGSNIFNVFCVIGSTAIVQPLAVVPSAVQYDLPFMCLGCLIFWPIFFLKGRASRLTGFSMIGIYVSYILFTFYGAS